MSEVWPPDRDLANKITAHLKHLGLIRPSADSMCSLEIGLARMIGESETFKKANAFDVLIKHVSAKLPTECAIKQLSGLPLAEALQDFVIVPREEWGIAGGSGLL